MILHTSSEVQEVKFVELELEVKKLEDRETKAAGCMTDGSCLNDVGLGLTCCGT